MPASSVTCWCRWIRWENEKEVELIVSTKRSHILSNINVYFLDLSFLLYFNLQCLHAVDVLNRTTSQRAFIGMIPPEESSQFNREEERIVNERQRGKDYGNEIRNVVTSISTDSSPKRCASRNSLRIRRRLRVCRQTERDVNQRLTGSILLLNGPIRHIGNEQGASISASASPA